MSDITLLIDSNYIAHQARYSLKGLSHDDIPTGIIFGFLSRILSLGQRFKTNDFVFFWDSVKSLRKRKHSFYKKKRHSEKTEEEMQILKIAFKQFDILREEILPQMGFYNNILQTGYEADDTIAKVVMDDIGEFIVITADDDLFQLLNYCDIYNPQKNILMTKRLLEAEKNSTPDDWWRMKALAGCSTDEVPGAKGVGEKMALKFLHDKLKETSKAHKSITDFCFEGLVKRNEWLVRLPLLGTLPIELIPNGHVPGLFFDICKELGMESFLKESKKQQWMDFFYGHFDNAPDGRNSKEIIKSRRRKRK